MENSQGENSLVEIAKEIGQTAEAVCTSITWDDFQNNMQQFYSAFNLLTLEKREQEDEWIMDYFADCEELYDHLEYFAVDRRVNSENFQEEMAASDIKPVCRRLQNWKNRIVDGIWWIS